ncbi:amidohydrolase [Ekhidna sp.]|uniref:amidohydrolase n=1 Tax=Ekhidna sp. TaxID=2608089 RepID=UPI0032EADA50
MKKTILTLFTLIFSSVLFAQKFDKQIEKMVAQTEKDVIEWRHWFHQNAELSNREFETAKRITEILTEIGYEPQTGVAKTGVVAILKGGKPGPVVGLRADIDGLPVKERVELPWASKQMGEYNGEQVPVMHACGHDTHISILLGVAKMLWEMKEEVPGTVKFIFQPAEEGAPKGEEGGAKLMVKEGVLKNPDVEAIFGLHINAQTPVGKLKVRPEGIMAAVNSMRIDIKGKQAHGSAPWDGVDPVVTAAQMINNFQTIISRNMQLTEAPAVLTIGAIHGGVRYNIIPEDLYMLGTIRTLDADMRTQILKRIREVAQKTGESNNAEVEVWIDEGYPVTYNEPTLYDQMLPTLMRAAGEENVEIIKPITGAEDFSFFQEQIPGLYFFVGGCPPENNPDEVAGHHTPDFYVDDAGMKLGMKAMMGLTLDYMSK